MKKRDITLEESLQNTVCYAQQGRHTHVTSLSGPSLETVTLSTEIVSHLY